MDRSGQGWAQTSVVPGPDSVVPFAAVLILTAVLLLAPQAFVPGLGRVRIAFLTGAFAIATHCWTRFAMGRPLMRFTREIWLAGALLAWAIVTLPLSHWPAASMQILVGDYLKALGVFWLVSNTVSTLGRLRAAAWALSLTAAPLAATGVWNFLSGRMVAGRIVGYDAPLTADPNALAMVLNLILPLTVALLLISRRPMVRGVLAGLIALDACAIIVTFSRGGFLTLATIFVLYLRTLQQWGKWRWAIVAIVLAVATIPQLPSRYLDRLGTISDIQGDKADSVQERWGLVQAGLSYVTLHPIGAGLGMNVIADCELRREGGLPVGRDCPQACFRNPRPFPPCLFVHNVYLQYAMDLGWLGLGLFLLLLLSCVRSAARVRERCAGLRALWELASIAEAVRITLVAFAVAALFYPWAYFVYFYCAAALAVAAGAVYEAEVRLPASPAPAQEVH